MKAFLSQIQKNRFDSRSFRRFFLPLFACITALFIIFSLLTYQRSRKILETEFLSSSNQDLACVGDSIDQLISDTKYLIATLVTNNSMQPFYSNSSPETIWGNYSNQIYAQLTVLRYSQAVIENIYLYSEASSIYIPPPATAMPVCTPTATGWICSSRTKTAFPFSPTR